MQKSASRGSAGWCGWQIMGDARRPRMPAKANSLTPSGRGMTAETSSPAGRRRDVHRSRFLAADGRGVVRADAALKAGIAGRPRGFVVIAPPATARDTSPGSSDPARAVRGPRCNLRQGDVGAAVVGPTGQPGKRSSVVCFAITGPRDTAAPAFQAARASSDRAAGGAGRRRDSTCKGDQRRTASTSRGRCSAPAPSSRRGWRAWKLAVLRRGEEHRRPAGAKQPPAGLRPCPSADQPARRRRPNCPAARKSKTQSRKSSIAHNGAMSL